MSQLQYVLHSAESLGNVVTSVDK